MPLWFLDIYTVVLRTGFSAAFCNYKKSKNRIRFIIRIFAKVTRFIIVSAAIGTKGRILSSFYWHMRAIDDAVDGDRTLQGEMTIHQYLEHENRLILSLPNIENWQGDIFTEDVFLIHTVRAAKERLGIDICSEVASMWREYNFDVSRIVSKEFLPTPEVQALFTSSNIRLSSIALLILDVKIEDSRRVAFVIVPTLLMLDNLMDIKSDLNKGLINMTEAFFETWNIDVERLKQYKSWEELRDYPEFLAWYKEQTKQACEDWQSIKVKLPAIMRCIPNVVYRKIAISYLIRKADRWARICTNRFA